MYTRNQALEDGQLIDTSTIATKYNINIPVAITSNLWAELGNTDEEKMANLDLLVFRMQQYNQWHKYGPCDYDMHWHVELEGHIELDVWAAMKDECLDYFPDSNTATVDYCITVMLEGED